MARLSILALSAAFILPLTAQQSPQHAPDGAIRERIQNITILPTPNAPFTATVTAEWKKLLPDGTTSVLSNHRTVARDSSGRIFEERRAFIPNGDTQQSRITNLQYSDPARHEMYDCHPERRLCVVFQYNAPTSVSLTATNPFPSDLGTTVTKDLGTRNTEGLDTIGSQQITTLRAGAFGNDTPQPIVKEFWYSPHLQINVAVQRFDPRSGQQNFKVGNINLTEPDPKLLTVPADYKLVPTSPYATP
ncbi:hypothetical protein [Granulicella arctica]|uniref:hypothetical protein n=1 Tax=Granulicella arctica TaxID=940613 RepID=UPI0021E06984|nr:hypothetical protein [Granulicella arctica]